MQQIPFYNFDLDLSASKRWEHIADIYAPKFPEIRNSLRDILGQFGTLPTLIRPLYSMTPSRSIMYHDEICYIASRINMDPFEILLMQLVYETSSACTSTIIRIGEKEVFFRTMDWPLHFLKD